MGKLDWFGRSRKEIWRKLSAEIDASYTEGSMFKGDRIDVGHGAWTITLDVSTVIVNNMPITSTRFPGTVPQQG